MAQTIFKSSAIKTAITMKLSEVIRQHLTGLGYEFDNGYEGIVQNPHDDALLVDFHAKYDLDENVEFVDVIITQIRVAHYRRDKGVGASTGRFTAQMKLERREALGMARYRCVSCRIHDHDLDEEETFRVVKM